MVVSIKVFALLTRTRVSSIVAISAVPLVETALSIVKSFCTASKSSLLEDHFW